VTSGYSSALYIRCRMGHYNGYSKFEFNHIISLYNKNDSECLPILVSTFYDVIAIKVITN